MATKKKRSSKGRSKRRSQRSTSPIPRRRRDEKAALRGMMIGGGILVLIALVAFVRIGGETPLNHLIAAFSSGEDSTQESPAKTAKTPIKGPRRTINLNPSRTLKPKISATTKPNTAAIPSKVSNNAAKAPPLETTTDGDKAGLDRLIKTKTQ